MIWRRFILIPLLIAVVIFGGATLYLWHQNNNRILQGTDSFLVLPGDNAWQIGDRLQRQGLIDGRWSFVLLARIRDIAGQFKAGEYRLEKDRTLKELMDLLVEGTVVSYATTLVEGWTFRRIIEHLEKEPALGQKFAGMTDEEIMRQLGYPDRHPEGHFFPSTYHYTRQHDGMDVLALALKKMNDVLAVEWAKRSSRAAVNSASDTVILASIIEKETAVDSERPIIAGVFSNRLRLRMRLQTDPTVIYGLAESFAGNLTRQHLRADSPYNTYTRFGLPPTPIAMPGQASINAALHPAMTDSLYFVSRGDGTHVFSNTLEEHQAAVRKWQINGKRKKK